MPSLTEADLFLADLKDDLFACYAVVGSPGGKAWKTARRAVTLIPQVNVYRFDDHETLKSVSVSGKPVGVVFTRSGSESARLSQALAEDLDSVLKALETALRASS